MRHDTRASTDIASRMRYEVFAKGNIPALTAEGVRLRSLGIASINLPNKQRSEDMLSQARAVRAGYDSASASAGAPAAPRLHVCVHWSVKNQYERSVDATFKKWCAFLSAAPAAQVDEVLEDWRLGGPLAATSRLHRQPCARDPQTLLHNPHTPRYP